MTVAEKKFPSAKKKNWGELKKGLKHLLEKSHHDLNWTEMEMAFSVLAVTLAESWTCASLAFVEAQWLSCQRVTFLKSLSRPLFLHFRLFYIIQLTDKFLPMLGFELQIFGVGSNCSANCATTTANSNFVLYLDFDNFTANKIVLACFHRCNCSALELSSDPI